MASYNAEYCGHPTMPEDMLIEIFVRSSVKSLLRAKCVCKHWYGLIKSHSFEDKYLEYQKNMNPSRLLLQYFNYGAREFSYAVLDDITHSSGRHLDRGYLRLNTYALDIYGPVNGLYCLYNLYDRIVLWNPALRVFKVLPSPPPHFVPHYKVAGGNIGFGIDPLTKDYKVVLFLYYYNVISDHLADENPIVTLYRLTTNTWRPLDLGDLDLHNSILCDVLGSSLIKGIYHWWVDSGGVLAFDMGKETFRMIPGPNISNFDNIYYFDSSITVYEEHVALVRSNDRFVHIWLMLEEGIWIKQFSIGSIPWLFSPIGFWKKEGVFLVTNYEPDSYQPDSQLTLYDLDTLKMRNVKPKATYCYIRTCLYSESLVSFGRNSEYDWNMLIDFFNQWP